MYLSCKFVTNLNDGLLASWSSDRASRTEGSSSSSLLLSEEGFCATEADELAWSSRGQKVMYITNDTFKKLINGIKNYHQTLHLYTALYLRELVSYT